MATAAQLYGSVVAPNRCVFPSTGRLRFSPFPPSRVSSPPRKSTLLASKIPTSTFVKKNSFITIAFDANTSIKYTEDQTPSADSECSEVVTQTNTVLASNVEEISPPPKNYAKIHDFCLGIPYGGFLLTMGVIGFLIWRNLESLLLGIAPGAAIFGLGITSLKVWRGGKSCVPFILAQAAVASILVWKYIQAFNLTKKLLPWGFYGFISVAMICFYLYVLVSGGNSPPKKKAMAPSS